MKKMFDLGIMLMFAMFFLLVLVGCNTYDVMYFNKDGTPYCQLKMKLTDIGKITESTKDKSWIKWHNGVIVLGEFTLSSETNGVPCFKGLFGDYDDGMAFFVKDQKDFEGMAKVVAAARRSNTKADITASGMSVANEKDRAKVWLPGEAPGEKKSGVSIPQLPDIPDAPATPVKPEAKNIPLTLNK